MLLFQLWKKEGLIINKKVIMLIALIEMLLLVSCEVSDSMSLSEQGTTIITDESSAKNTSINSSSDSTVNDSENIDSSLEYAENLSYVDEKLKSVTSNDDYQNGDIDTRVELLQPILDQLLIEERIVEYHLELKGSRPNVSIKYAGGGNGCILLKEFTKDEN